MRIIIEDCTPEVEGREVLCQVLKGQVWLYFVSFFRHVVSKEGIWIDPTMIKAVKGWTRP